MSLTGSDALIHALYKLNVADEAWERTGVRGLGSARKRGVSDLFAVQKHITEKLRHVLGSELRRGFAAAQGQAARASPVQDLAPPAAAHVEHASGELEREQNAKRRYIRAAIDERSAWELFDDVPDLKKNMTAHVFRAVQEAADVPLEQSLAKLDEQHSDVRTTIARIAAHISVAAGALRARGNRGAPRSAAGHQPHR